LPAAQRAAGLRSGPSGDLYPGLGRLIIIQVLDPSNGKILRELDEDDAGSVQAKAAAARDAARGWTRIAFDERRRILTAFGLRVERETERLAAILSSETGKPVSRASAELAELAPSLRDLLDAAARLPLSRALDRQGLVSESVALEPLGSIAFSSDWRFPYLEGGSVLLPALAFGNSLLYRPSVHTLLTGGEILRLMREAGLPEGVLQLVTGGNRAWLVETGIDGFFFNGSFAGGARMAQASAKHLISLQMQLGRKDAVYVREDADAESAAERIVGAVRSGLSRGAPERLYVHRGVYGSFLDAFVAAFDRVVFGDPADPATDVGPLPKAVLVDALDEQAREAVGRGAKALRGCRRLETPGNWFEPGVLVGVDDAMSVSREESYGRLFGICCVATDEEAAQRIDASEFGAAAAVFTGDPEAGRTFLEGLDCGMVFLNCVGRISSGLPSPVRGRSGLGLRGGIEGLQTFLKPKASRFDRS